MKKNGTHILLADDDRFLCSIIKTLLQQRGYTVEVVKNGQEAMEMIKTKPHRYDILITDHDMPIVTGLELVGHLRKSEFQGKIMVISGCLTGELETAYMQNRVDKIFEKPFSLEALADLMAQSIEKWKTEIC